MIEGFEIGDVLIRVVSILVYIFMVSRNGEVFCIMFVLLGKFSCLILIGSFYVMFKECMVVMDLCIIGILLNFLDGYLFIVYYVVCVIWSGVYVYLVFWLVNL